MKKKKILSLIILLVGTISLTQCTDSNETNKSNINNTTNIEIPENITINNNKYAEDTIIKLFNAMNNHNETEVKKYYTNDELNQKSDFRLNNLKSIKINKISLINDKKEYKSFLETGIPYKVSIENVKIYVVNCTVEYKDQTKEPIDNGNYDIKYNIIKDSSNNWKVYSSGTI